VNKQRAEAGETKAARRARTQGSADSDRSRSSR